MAIVFLVDEKTNLPLKVGDKRKTFRGDEVTITGWPSTGRNRVTVSLANGMEIEYFPDVIGAKLV